MPAVPSAPAAPDSVAIGVAIGLVALTGVTSAMPAVAATQSLATQVIAAAPEGSPAETLLEIAEDAQSTRDAARAALIEAAAVTADIAASGLDVGAANTVVDTTDLRARLDRMSGVDLVPALLVPGLSEDTATETRRVVARATDLRGKLEAAQAQKAAEEAAAAAAAAAQKAAEEAAAEAQRQAEAAAAALAAANTPEGAKVIAQQMASASYGWGQISSRASCRCGTRSPAGTTRPTTPSGATGIPQALPGSKMASAGSDWQTNATTQIAWGLELHLRPSTARPAARGVTRRRPTGTDRGALGSSGAARRKRHLGERVAGVDEQPAARSEGARDARQRPFVELRMAPVRAPTRQAKARSHRFTPAGGRNPPPPRPEDRERPAGESRQRSGLR